VVQQNNIHGILVINKPKGPSSHAIVFQVRKTLNVRAGHTGTLDPMATGVLPIVVGKGRRLARFYQQSDKRYRAKIQLGEETNTYDAEGDPIKRFPVPELEKREISDLLSAFKGKQQQTPPMFSAVKIQGKRLYKLARKDKSVDRPARTVVFYDIELIDMVSDSLVIDIHCSSGTYIRTLAFDIGRRIGCGAHLSSLQRISSGQFHLEDSIAPDEVAEHWQKALVPLEQLLPDFPIYELSESEAVRISHGNSIPCEHGSIENIRLMFRAKLIAIGEIQAGVVKPTIVLRTDN
jgi:tRNA pseudouridine55 synthase